MSTFEKTHTNKVIRGPKRATYDKELIYKIVDDHMICHVAYNYEGTPITIPTGYGRKNDTIYLHGSQKNRMMTSIETQEHVSITVTHLDGLVVARSVFHHSVNYRSAILFGKPRKVEDEKEKMEALQLITDNFIPGRWEEARQPNEKEFNATLVIAVEIVEASAKVRAEGVNDESFDLDLPIWAGVVPFETKVGKEIPEIDLLENVPVPKSIRQFQTVHG